MSKQPPKMPKPPRKPRPAFTDGNAPAPAVVAVDAQPRAGDACPRPPYAGGVGDPYIDGIADRMIERGLRQPHR